MTLEHKKGLASGAKAARKFLKEAQGGEHMISAYLGMEFANSLKDFVTRSVEGTSWWIARAQLPSEEAQDKSRYYDVRIVNPEGYEDEYEEDIQSMHDNEAKVSRFARYDNVMLEITMAKGVDYMTTPTVVLSFEKRTGDKDVLAVERIHQVSDETFNDVVVYLVEDFVTGDDEKSLLIPEDVAERYGLLLKRI